MLAQYAIRRLQQVKSQDASDFLRSLVYEIASLLPIHWHDFHSAAATGSSNTLLKQADVGNVNISSPRTPEKCLTPQLSRLLHRMLAMFHHSLELVACRDATEANDVDAAKVRHEQPTSSQEAVESRSPAEGFPKAHENGLLHLSKLDKEVLDRVDVNSILSTAFVAAVYEHLGIVAPVDLSSYTTTKQQPLGPTVFWSENDARHSNNLVTLRDDALGDEMHLQITK